MSIENYRKQKRLEYAMSMAEKQPMSAIEQSQAIIDYNVMMGHLKDPELEKNDE